MTELGWIYRNGLGVTRDYDKAREWFEKAVAANYGGGMHGLGFLYEQGEGVPKDYAKAREWYEKAAAAGNSFGMNSLGVLNQNGWGMSQDYAKAREWYEKAIASNNRFAPRNLAILLDNGKGGSTDYARAAKLILDAAKANNTTAIEDLRNGLPKWNRSTRIEVKRELSRQRHLIGPTDTDDLGRRRAPGGHQLPGPGAVVLALALRQASIAIRTLRSSGRALSSPSSAGNKLA